MTVSRYLRRMILAATLPAVALTALLVPASVHAELPWMAPRAQPFYDFPWQAQHQGCPWPPGEWACDSVGRDPNFGPPGGDGSSEGEGMIPPGGYGPRDGFTAPGAGGAGGCQECNADGSPMDVPMRPVAHRKCGWYYTGDFVPLFYDGNSGREFARIGQTATTALADNNLRTEFDSGVRYLLGTALTKRLSVEGMYLGHYNYRTDAAVRDNTANGIGGTGVLSSPFTNFGTPALVPGLDYNNLVTADFRNRFSTADINFKYLVDMHPGPFDLYVTVGGRYINMDEQFRYHAEANRPLPSGAVNDVLVNTANQLFGPQLGFEGNYMVADRYWVEVKMKGAICNNSVSQNTTYTNVDSAAVLTATNTAKGEERTAYVGDLSAIGNFQLTPNISFRAGYQATWITGAALAIDNFQTNTQILTLGPAQLDHTGTAVYHGPVLGLTWAR